MPADGGYLYQLLWSRTVAWRQPAWTLRALSTGTLGRVLGWSRSRPRGRGQGQGHAHSSCLDRSCWALGLCGVLSCGPVFEGRPGGSWGVSKFRRVGGVFGALSRWEELQHKSVISRRAGGKPGSGIQAGCLVWTTENLSWSRRGRVRKGAGPGGGVQGHVMTSELDRRCGERRERRGGEDEGRRR